MTSEKQLETSLNSLLSEIKGLEVGDAETRQRMERLVQDIEKMLSHPQDAGAQSTIGERWRTSVLTFEASHPRLAGVMNEVLEQLSNMGI